MLKKLSFLISMPFMAVLMILLIVILALATFVESAYSTQTAWALVYGTHWFELLLLLIGINVAGVMLKHKFFRRRKIVVFLFHIAFILILVGAAITRFISYEGNMHIRENTASSTMLSTNAYIDVVLESNGEQVEKSKEVRLTDLTPRDFRMSTQIGDDKVKIRSTEYMSNAVEQYVAAPGGEPYMQIMLVSDRQTTVGIPSGSTQEVMGMRIALNNADTTALLNFISEGEQVYLYSAMAVTVMQMGGETGQEYQPGEQIPVQANTLYSLGHMRLALQDFMPSAGKQIVKAQAGQRGTHLGAVRLEIKYRGMTKDLYVPGLARIAGQAVTGAMGDLSYAITYGSREISVPFSLFLNDFEVERYPGSNSPSSFASDVVLLDQELGIQEERRIFMNNVLKHRGYRFYQASYDQDEMGSVLSVNKDWAGTFVTYLGYLVLIAGMLVALFVPGTRFALIAKKSAPAAKVAIVALLLLGGSMSVFSQEVPPRDVAQEFGYLWVQDKGGRYKPMNTLSSEVVRKITKKSHYGSYSADQVLLGMIMYPASWQQKPLFKIKHPDLHQIVGYKGEMVSFTDLMDSTGSSYLLSNIVNEAYSKQVTMQTELDREVIKLDDRVNALYLIQSGGLLRIFPDPGAENHKWASVSEAMSAQISQQGESMSAVFMEYLNALQESDYATAQSRLKLMHDNQLKNEDLLPSHSKKKMEILYNRINIFPRLASFYGLFGVILMVLQFLIIFKPRKLYRGLFNIGVIHLVVAFVLHTLALTGRWYISGHAPMSNGYESMIFVSWVTLLAGLIFVKRSGYAMALTGILAALALMVAGMSNMNPEITNLVPVLKSPWLTIHVAVIMAGYGFLGLASIMGLLNVVLYAILSPSNKSGMQEVIQQVTRVNHLTLIVGLYFMTAGVFLGGVWANESWGRYWGWDPKETWALITVLVYAFVTHMHRIPGLRGQYAFNLATFISYSSVMMTYFGVNYFLGGMHSYASGSAFKIPLWVYALIVLLAALSGYAYKKQQKLLPELTGKDV
ncbi:MAG: cytochrome c biogenesis protein CcsA [Bacteroidota bacterium]